MADKPFLVTLLPSTDVDITRWCLQHWQIDYKEHPHAPVFHVLAILWYGATSYPVFVDRPRKLAGIDAILPAVDERVAAERRLLPDAESEPALHEEVMQLQNDFRWKMGNGTVNWAYYHLLPHKDLTWPSFTTGVPWFERAFLSFGYGLIRFILSKGLNLSAKTAQEGLDEVRRGFDLCEKRLADGRPFLCGDRLTFADIAFAGSAAPMVLAEGYGGHLPTVDQVPQEMQTVIAELRARPAGAFVKRLYDDYRL